MASSSLERHSKHPGLDQFVDQHKLHQSLNELPQQLGLDQKEFEKKINEIDRKYNAMAFSLFGLRKGKNPKEIKDFLTSQLQKAAKSRKQLTPDELISLVAKKLDMGEATIDEAKLTKLWENIQKQDIGTIEYYKAANAFYKEIARSKEKYGAGSWWMDYFTANMFLGIGTTELNILGNMTALGRSFAEMFGGASRRAFFSTITGDFDGLKREAYSIRATMRNTMQGFGRGISSAYDIVFKGDFSVKNLYEQKPLDASREESVTFTDAARIRSYVGYTMIPSIARIIALSSMRTSRRLLGGMDALFKITVQEMMEAEAARLIASKTTKNYQDFLVQYRSMVANTPIRMAAAKKRIQQLGIPITKEGRRDLAKQRADESGKEGIAYKLEYNSQLSRLNKLYNGYMLSYTREDMPAIIKEYGSKSASTTIGTNQPDPDTVMGGIAAMINMAKARIPFLKITFPVVNFVANFINLNIETTPLEAVSIIKDLTAGTVYGKGKYADVNWSDMSDPKTILARNNITQRVTRMLYGTLGYAAIYFLAGADDDETNCFDMFGEGPTDPIAKSQLMEAGWKPYSMRFDCGGDYYSMKWAMPFYLGLAFVGNLRDQARYKTPEQDKVLNQLSNKFFGIPSYKDLPEEQLQELMLIVNGGRYELTEAQRRDELQNFATFTLSPLKAIFEQTFLTGIEDQLKIITSDAKASEKAFYSYSANLATLALMPNMAREIAKATDNKVYNAKTLTDYFLKAAPVVSLDESKVRLDVFGREATYYDPEVTTTPEQIFMRVIKSDITEDKVVRYMAENGIFVTMPKDDVGMDDNFFRTYMKVQGNALYKYMEQRLAAGAWEGVPKEYVLMELDMQVRAMRNQAKNILDMEVNRFREEGGTLFGSEDFQDAVANYNEFWMSNEPWRKPDELIEVFRANAVDRAQTEETLNRALEQERERTERAEEILGPALQP